MKRIVYAAVAGLSVFLIIKGLKSDQDMREVYPGGKLEPSGNPKPVPDPAQYTDTAVGESIENLDDKLVPRTEAAVDLDSLGIDAGPFRDITSDPALIRILATYSPPSVGIVSKDPKGRSVLEMADGRRFEASEIGEVRSQANDGTVAFEALVSGDAGRIREVDGQDGKVKTTGLPVAIWVITSKGRSERISPENSHSEHPIISADGRFVAFTSRSVVEGMLRPQVLMIRDRVNGRLMSFGDRSHGMDYEIKAVDWVEDGNVLRVIEDWGETGGHLKLKEVRPR